MQPDLIQTLREAVISVLGAPPDPAPLRAEVLNITQEKTYRREHVRYQVSPHEWCYSYLLIPHQVSGGAPAIYCHHRFNNTYHIGKSEVVGLAGSVDEAIGIDLVQRGYVVLAPDAIAFEERRAPASTSHADDQTYNYQQLALRLLRGETLLRKIIWDVSRGVDYLETRPEVNSHRLGFMGHGYGGQLAVWALALERRLKVGVSHNGVKLYRNSIKRGDLFLYEFTVPRLMQVADLHHILRLVAPHPFLLSTANDLSAKADAEETYLKALPVYEKLGISNRLSLYEFTEQDTMSPVVRHGLYSWLDSWLKPFSA